MPVYNSPSPDQTISLTGHVTSVGNAAVLGSFTLAQLNTAISDADVATGGGTATGTNTGDQTNIAGNAATVTTNANLTGHITSTGNATVLGSFTKAQLDTALSDYNTLIGETVAVGKTLLGANARGTGVYGVAIGNDANIGSNSYNTIVGAFSGYNIGTGGSNTALGGAALYYNTTGGYNTALGYAALYANAAFDNCTGLGSNAAVTASNQVQLGDSYTTTYAYGAVQNRSDVRDKTDIQDINIGLEFIKKLRPVNAKWDMREDYRTKMPESFDSDMAKEQWMESQKLANITHDGTHARSRYHHMLIAQEVKAVMTEMNVDFAGYQDHSLKGGDDVLSIGYTELIPVLIKAIQEQQVMIRDLQSRSQPQ
jgi:hypothetical protein